MASPAPEGERHKRAKEIATEVRAGFPTATATASVIGTGLWGGEPGRKGRRRPPLGLEADVDLSPSSSSSLAKTRSTLSGFTWAMTATRTLLSRWRSTRSRQDPPCPWTSSPSSARTCRYVRYGAYGANALRKCNRLKESSTFVFLPLAAPRDLQEKPRSKADHRVHLL